MFGDVANALRPGLQFIFFIEIVVALGRRNKRIVGKPSVVPAPVEADISDP